MTRFGPWVIALSLLSPVAVMAQQQSLSLDTVEELARMGRTESAREALGRWWDRSFSGASRRDAQRGLWLRGKLATDPAQATIDFRRLVVEYPGGSYSDLALFRLAQAAFAEGDSAGAARDVERLQREYPSSPARREAEAWLASAGTPPPPVPRSETVPPAPPAPSRAPAADRTGVFSVQLGAFQDRSRAEALRARAAGAGLDARLATLPGSDLVRVRVGRFDSSDEAHAILERVQDLGFTAAVVRDANREERSGG